MANSLKAFDTPSAEQNKMKKLEAQNDRRMRKVGQLSIECDFFAQACEDDGLKIR